MAVSAALLIIAGELVVAKDEEYCNARGDAVVTGDTYPGTLPNGKLLQVHVAMRHGARTPANRVPDDREVKWTDEDCAVLWLGAAGAAGSIGDGGIMVPTGGYDVAWDDLPEWGRACAFGELTRLGAESSRKTGEHLREVYVDSLGFLIAPDAVEVWATQSPRTHATAAAVVAGLFPADTTSAIGEAPPVRIKSKPWKYEDMVFYVKPGIESCPREEERYAELRENRTWIDAEASASSLRAKVDEVLGTNDSWWTHQHGLNAFDHTFDVLQCRCAQLRRFVSSPLSTVYAGTLSEVFVFQNSCSPSGCATTSRSHATTLDCASRKRTRRPSSRWATSSINIYTATRSSRGCRWACSSFA